MSGKNDKTGRTKNCEKFTALLRESHKEKENIKRRFLLKALNCEAKKRLTKEEKNLNNNKENLRERVKLKMKK